MGWRKPANKEGFLLLEVLVVLALVAALMALSGACSSFVRRALVRAEIEKLHTICCYLKQVAQVSNGQCTLSFDVQKGLYRYEDTVETLPKQVMFGAPMRVLGPPSAPLKAVTRGVTFPQDQIVFYPSGIVHAGTVYLSDTGGAYTCALSCAVSQVSYLRKYFYDDGWCLLK